MPAIREKAEKRRLKPLMVIVVLVGVLVGLAACRGFFGQGPIALLEILNTDDQEVPVVLSFDLSASNDPDGTIATFELDFGDGSTATTGTDVSVVLTHTYTEAGTYTITLTITDNDGRIGMDQETVTIGPVMITFASRRIGQFDIWRMEADGTNQGAVLSTPDEELFPALVRGTRGKIAFASDAAGDWNISVMNVAGTSVAPLTIASPQDIQPSWSRDGGMIAFASNEAQTPSRTTWQIWTMTETGAGQTQLTTQTPSWAIAPAYSPLNDDILFVTDAGPAAGGSAIWLWDDSGSSASVLYDSSGRDGDVSPAGFPAGLAVPLDLPVNAGVSKPAWSPDGTKIAFSTDQGAGIDIYVMDANGTGAETLEAYVDSLVTGTITAGSITPLGATAHEFCPYWLEDGAGLAFVKNSGIIYDLYVVSFSNGAVTQLTSTGENVTPAQRR